MKKYIAMMIAVLMGTFTVAHAQLTDEQINTKTNTLAQHETMVIPRFASQQTVATNGNASTMDILLAGMDVDASLTNTLEEMAWDETMKIVKSYKDGYTFGPAGSFLLSDAIIGPLNSRNRLLRFKKGDAVKALVGIGVANTNQAVNVYFVLRDGDAVAMIADHGKRSYVKRQPAPQVQPSKPKKTWVMVYGVKIPVVPQAKPATVPPPPAEDRPTWGDLEQDVFYREGGENMRICAHGGKNPEIIGEKYSPLSKVGATSYHKLRYTNNSWVEEVDILSQIFNRMLSGHEIARKKRGVFVR